MLVEKVGFFFTQIAKMAFFHPVFRKEMLDCTLCSIRIDLTFADVLGKQMNHHKVWNFTAVFRNRWEFMPSHRYNPSKVIRTGSG